jgi:tRNA(Ile)-lysidine synthetase-like protein
MRRLVESFETRKYVVAFSGGADSLALLCLTLLFVPGENVIAATLDHSARPDSEAATREAEELARTMGVRTAVRKVAVPELAAERKKGFEEAGRAARYRFLEEVREGAGFDYVMTGHQGNDQAETVILKLVRGAGPGCLAGIAAKRGRTLRPLLVFGAGELRDYLRARGLRWLEDPTNADPKHARNLVRHKIVPVLSEANPGFLNAFRRLGEIARAEEEHWERILDDLERTIVKKRATDRGEVFETDRARFDGLGLAEKRRLVGRLMRKTEDPRPGGGEPQSFEGAEKALAFLGRRGGGGEDLPGGRRIEMRGGVFGLGLASRFSGGGTRGTRGKAGTKGKALPGEPAEPGEDGSGRGEKA